MPDRATFSSASSVSPGDILNLTVERMAHGGEGIALLDGRVVFVRGGFPGDHLRGRITRVKKSYLKAVAVEILQPSDIRVPNQCPAAEAGAGCCDYAAITPEAELDLKVRILTDQARRLAKLAPLPAIEKITLKPTRGWRTRVRLGVDKEGRAGVRALASHDIVPIPCTQVVPGLLDGIVGAQARHFTPGAEVIAVMDSEGVRHVVETRKAPRGRRSERVTTVVEGDPEVVEKVEGYSFRFPVTAFWQAHRRAPATYAGLIRTWLLNEYLPEKPRQVGWDLYGGVGLFVPALYDALRDDEAGAEDVEIHSVDISGAAGRAAHTFGDLPVFFHRTSVEKILHRLPDPSVVILDPPRSGAGSKVIEGIAQHDPDIVIHIGCDPATLLRDVACWQALGYRSTRVTLINAFPGTHHSEVVTMLRKVETS